MGSMSLVHWVVVVAVVLIVFGGGGKISTIMGDFARGIKSFKKNMAEDESLAESDAQTGQITPPIQAETFTSNDRTRVRQKSRAPQDD